MLAGKVALVGAASQGLGKAAALALARAGASVAICARREAAITAAAAAIAADTGAEVLPLVADLSEAGAPARVVRETIARFGALDILVTNTGGPPSAPFMALSDEDWQYAFDSLVMGTVRLCREAVPHMRARGGGRIIHITSISTKQAEAGLCLSNSVRMAVTGLSKTLANELAADRILVNCVAPGFTRTERVTDIAQAVATREGLTPDQVEARIVKQIPLGRLGEAHELAGLIAFLASDHGSYITGTTIQVDGGLVRGSL